MRKIFVLIICLSIVAPCWAETVYTNSSLKKYNSYKEQSTVKSYTSHKCPGSHPLTTGYSEGVSRQRKVTSFQGRSSNNGCISGHWLSKKNDDGSILILEDGSTWQIEFTDRITTTFWLPTDSIIVCEGDGTLINTDDNGEKVYARRLR